MPDNLDQYETFQNLPDPHRSPRAPTDNASSHAWASRSSAIAAAIAITSPLVSVSMPRCRALTCETYSVKCRQPLPLRVGQHHRPPINRFIDRHHRPVPPLPRRSTIGNSPGANFPGIERGGFEQIR